MRLTRTLAGVAAGAMLAAGLAVAAAPAATAASSPAIPATGVTSVTTAPGLAGALIRNGVVPYGLGSTSTRLVLAGNGLQVRYGFPVTGVTLDDPAAGAADPANVDVLHSGGLAFANVLKGTRVTTRHYTIDISAGVITAEVTANGAPVGRIPVYEIDLSAASISYTVPTDGKADVRNVTVRLADGVAGVLNSTLKTRVFTENATIGTARVVVSSVG